MTKYAVDIFDGISGDSAEFGNLEDAKKRFLQEKEYRDSNGLSYEFIELYSFDDETNEKIETIMEV